MQKKIIIADDDYTIHLPLTYFLTEAGYMVKTVGDGQEALEAILEESRTENPFDLLITDIEMPRLNGLELIERLQAERIFIPVIAISGVGNREMVKALEKTGCRAYLDKPVQERILINRIESILEIPGETARESEL